MEINELNRNAKGGTELIHTELEKRLPQELRDKFQIIPSRVRELDPKRKPVLVLHDLPSDPESEHLRSEESRERFAGLVCVSNWQANMYNLTLNIPFAELTVIQNAINPIGLVPKPDDGIVRLIYHTTPHRGLGILVPVFEHLCELHDNIELDVYSSFNAYGWPERDKPFEELFERCKAHPKINYHGFKENAAIRVALQKADIFAYPSVWPETSCIAAIEAMSAGCITVCPSYAALPETCANFAWMYPFTEIAQDHANRFAGTLNNAILEVSRVKKENDTARMSFQRNYFNNFYGWNYRQYQWEQYLRQLP
jgi:UDP-glucose:(glucosyl)LPS alpha-1,2-glucosyltransferase